MSVRTLLLPVLLSMVQVVPVKVKVFWPAKIYAHVGVPPGVVPPRTVVDPRYENVRFPAEEI